MSHSHLLVHHLLKQLENHKRERRDCVRRPEWLNAFIHQTAALFEPLAGVGRVGYQCEPSLDGWEARLYSGFDGDRPVAADDGQSRMISFSNLDLARLAEGFARVDEFRWNVCSNLDGTSSSFVTMWGLVDDNSICLKIYSRPPSGRRTGLPTTLAGWDAGRSGGGLRRKKIEH